MDDKQRGMALTIKSCLDTLKEDATNNALFDLARFIGLAALAAEEAALSEDSQAAPVKVFNTTSVGHC
jgi:hypothetical protein